MFFSVPPGIDISSKIQRNKSGQNRRNEPKFNLRLNEGVSCTGYVTGKKFCSHYGRCETKLIIMFRTLCACIVHYIYMCVCIYIYIYIYVCLFMGSHALFMMDSHGQESSPLVIMGALNLVVWVCTQGDCCRRIFILHPVHDHHGVFVSIHVSQ